MKTTVKFSPNVYPDVVRLFPERTNLHKLAETGDAFLQDCLLGKCSPEISCYVLEKLTTIEEVAQQVRLQQDKHRLWRQVIKEIGEQLAE